MVVVETTPVPAPPPVLVRVELPARAPEPAPPPPAPSFAVARKDADPKTFGDIVAAKRYLDRHDDALRVVRLRDGVVMAYKARVSDTEMAHLAAMFRRHD